MATPPDYGRDIATIAGGGRIDLDVTFRLEAGTRMMASVCARRLYCRKGRLLSDKNDETVDARDFVSQGVGATEGGLARIKGLCQMALVADPRIFTAIVTPVFDSLERTLDLNIVGTGAFGPFALTLRVSELTIALLGPS